MISRKGALPETVFAVEAYVNFVRDKTLVEAVASSLTELFAPSIHKARISGMLENYDFISDDVMAYFKRRLTQAPRDANFALEYVKQNARTPEAQQGVLDALRFKTHVLVGAARCAVPRLCRAGHDPARSLRAGRSLMADVKHPGRLMVDRSHETVDAAAI